MERCTEDKSRPNVVYCKGKEAVEEGQKGSTVLILQTHGLIKACVSVSWGKGTAAHYQPAYPLRYFKPASGSELDEGSCVGGWGVRQLGRVSSKRNRQVFQFEFSESLGELL